MFSPDYNDEISNMSFIEVPNDIVDNIDTISKNSKSYATIFLSK